ncbi:hypothetical protein ZWY2020_050235 [Hordeum vulgare]|nr:hypothetical protein ZWY2020_050235 [Hordeum vulgare]
MLNNTSAILRRAVRSDLSMLLPPGWVLAREERMEGYIKDYLQMSWGPVVSRLDGKPGALNVLRRRNPLSAFYLALENTCIMQGGWKVPSPALRAACGELCRGMSCRRTAGTSATTRRLRCRQGAPWRSWRISCRSCSKASRMKALHCIQYLKF